MQHSSSERALAHWRPIERLDGAWELRRTHGLLPLRAVAVRLSEGTLCVYSPVPKVGQVALQELGALGTPTLLAPNRYHTLGLKEHAGAFPDAPIVASTQAAPRVRKKTGLRIRELDALKQELPAHITLLQCPAARSGEVWLSIRGARHRVWVVADAFLNFERLSSGPAGLLLKALRMGPGLSIGSTWTWLLKNRSAYRDWLLTKIGEERPTVLVPSHGRIVVDDALPTRLEQLVRERL